jgi:hypothetical protein
MSPYGGLVPVLKKVKEHGIPQLINSHLGKKVKQSKYSHADIFINWIIIALCHGRSINHIDKIRDKIPFMKKLRVASHDTIGRGMKRLAGEVHVVKTTSRDYKHKKRIMEVDNNLLLNQMLVKITKRMGAIKVGPKYVLDFDATFIPTMCRGAVRKYKKNGKLDYTKIGFSPMICMIGDLPVYMSNRNGDAGSRFQIYECLENCLKTLDEEGIRIGRVISDSAGYNKKAIAMMNSRGIKFNMRFPHKDNMGNFDKLLSECDAWRTTEIKTSNLIWDCEIADIDYVMSKNFYESIPEQKCRVVAIRIPTQKTRRKGESKETLRRRAQYKKQLRELRKKKILKEPAKPFEDKHWKKIGDYEYKFYITNDFEKGSEDIVLEYNKRGGAERKFHFMKEDYSWELPPFSKMNENTVFLIASSIANNIQKSTLILFQKGLPMLNRQSQLVNYFTHFIVASCLYLGSGQYIFSPGKIVYENLM